MAFWKKVTGKSSKSSKPEGSNCNQTAGDSIDYHGSRSEGRVGPLADYISENGEANIDLGQTTWHNLRQKSSRLSKTLQEFLAEPASLGYLIQYLEGRDADHLVRFYLDVQSFRGSAETKLTTSSGFSPVRVDRRRLECVPEDPDGQDLEEATIVTSSSSSSSFNHPSSPTSIEGSLLISESGESVDSGYSEFQKNDSDEGTSKGAQETLKTQTSDKTKATGSAASQLQSDNCQAQSSPEHLDNSRNNNKNNINNNNGIGPSSTYNPGTVKTVGSGSDTKLQRSAREDSRVQTLLKTRSEDAVKIYRKYIAPDASSPVRIPLELKREIVEVICDETGSVASQCFDKAQGCVVELLGREYFPDFLESEYHAKHQVDVLTGGKVLVTDILFNDIALFHFMEFMESEGQRPVVEFWMSANNFQQSVQRESEAGSGVTTHDAMILYDKFFSMQATSPLGFDSGVRLEVENNICLETGPGPLCFAKPLEITVGYMESRYLAKFLASKLFSNYVKELINKIQMSTRNFPSVPRLSATSNESLSSCSSDTNSRMSSSVSRNTLLASGDRLSNTQVPSSDSFRIEDGFLTDPDSLWRRTSKKSKVGVVDTLGRYHSSWEQAPDTIKDKETLMGKMRRLGRGDHTKLQEDMAWQMAEMFIKDVTSITLAEDNSPEFLDENENREDMDFAKHNNAANLSVLADSDDLDL